MLKSVFNFRFVKFFFLIIVFNNFFFQKLISGQELKLSNPTELYENNDKNSESFESNYILGPGDELAIEFLGLKDIFSGDYPINPEGFILLPEINYYKVEGKTLEELKKDLEIIYEEFVKEPIINIQIITYRPITFYLKGEIKSPGLYVMPIINNGNSNIFPKLFDAMKFGKGLNNNADISNIEIVRINSKSQGGGRIKTNIDLLDLLYEGKQDLNISIYDGDTITIKRSDKVLKDQLLTVARSNLTPNEISVIIGGNALNPGVARLKRGTTLVQALTARGGPKLYSGDIEFMRFNSDGSTTKRVFRYNNKAKINQKNNPILMDGDLINVKRTILGAGVEFTQDIVNPLIYFRGLTTLIKDW
tara:strand:- start:13 stop:1098 length:1086 start_codon:yes stop_codon:yes gene_type:complete